MKFFAIIFVLAAVTRVQCRSALSDLKDADLHRNVPVHGDAKQDASQSSWIETSFSRNSLNLTDGKIFLNTTELKDLVTSYEENFAKFIEFAIKLSKNKGNNEQQIQFLNQLGLLIEQIIKEQSKVRNMYTNLDNITDSVLQIASSKSMINVNDLKDLINIIKEINIIYQDGKVTDEHIRIKRAAEDKEVTLHEHMTDLLIDIQRQLMQNRKYLEKLCKKHHSALTVPLQN